MASYRVLWILCFHCLEVLNVKWYCVHLRSLVGSLWTPWLSGFLSRGLISLLTRVCKCWNKFLKAREMQNWVILWSKPSAMQIRKGRPRGVKRLARITQQIVAMTAIQVTHSRSSRSYRKCTSMLGVTIRKLSWRLGRGCLSPLC